MKYWPVEVGQPEVFGAYQVELSDDEREVGDYITRKFKLSPIDKVYENSTQFSVAACNRHCKYHLSNNRHVLYSLVKEHSAPFTFGKFSVLCQSLF